MWRGDEGLWAGDSSGSGSCFYRAPLTVLCGAALTWLLLHYRTSDLAWPGAELETDWSSRAINSGL